MVAQNVLYSPLGWKWLLSEQNIGELSPPALSAFRYVLLPSCKHELLNMLINENMIIVKTVKQMQNSALWNMQQNPKKYKAYWSLQSSDLLSR